jgi:hypothetical protein
MTVCRLQHIADPTLVSCEGDNQLLRRPRYHNEVLAYTSIHISGGPLLIMTVHRFQYKAGPAPVSGEGQSQYDASCWLVESFFVLCSLKALGLFIGFYYNQVRVIPASIYLVDLC